MTPTTVSFADLLRSAVTDPGVVSNAYQQFHSYSLGNQLLAWAQCIERGIQPGPMATFPTLEGAGPARPITHARALQSLRYMVGWHSCQTRKKSFQSA